MAKYIFLNVPAHGHVNPTLAVAQELVARGEEVSYYLTNDFRAAIEATGAKFHSYQSKITGMKIPNPNGVAPDQAPGQRNVNMMPLRMTEEGAHVIPQIIEQIRAEKPDYILYDMMCIWAKIVARSLNVPAILLRPSYASNKHFSIQKRGAQSSFKIPPEFFSQTNETLTALCQTYNVEPFGIQEMFMGAEPLNIVFIPKEFQPNSETFDERFAFVGPALQPRLNTSKFPLEKIAEKTVLYISLGTVFNNQAEFFNTCFAAFKDKPWQVVLSYGKNIDPADLDPIPENFLAAPYMPQLEVLARSSAFITHGGMNSTMESLYYGVPMISVPQMVEQAMTAQRVQELGLGIALERDNVSVKTLQEAVERVIDDATYRQKTQEMQQHVRNSGGAKLAADIIVKYTHTHQKSITPSQI